MIPKLHSAGHSFAGLAAYVLHDKDAATSERVAWTETRNLATQKPEVAWRIMAATAMNQDHLKAAAGVKNTGRKSKAHVLHLTLSWSAEEAPSLTREEMLRAADGAVAALGASHHQMLIVCHSDVEHPHIHLAINRVSAIDGRLLSSTKEHLRLSRWAEDYEKRQGTIRCPERVANNAARDRKRYTRGLSVGRVRYDRERTNGQDPTRLAELAAMAKADRKAREVRERAARELLAAHKAREAAIRENAREARASHLAGVRDRYRPQRRALLEAQRLERTQLIRQERTLLGRAQNTLRAIDFQALMKGAERRAALTKAFQVIGSQGARLSELIRYQQREADALRQQQQREEREAALRVLAERRRALLANHHRLLAERAVLQKERRDAAASSRNAWTAKRNELRGSAKQTGGSVRAQAKEKAPRLREEFARVSQPAEQESSQVAGDSRAAAVADFRKRMERRNAESREKGRGKDYER